jgi:hypothetical protein
MNMKLTASCLVAGALLLPITGLRSGCYFRYGND